MSLSRARIASSSGEVWRVIASYCSRQWETHAFSDVGVKMGVLGQNFGSRHAKKSSKSSIDAANHLVSNKSLSQNFGPLDWLPEPVKVGQKIKNTPTLRASPRRTPHPNQNIFFNRTKKTCRIRREFEHLSSCSRWRVITKNVRAIIMAPVVVKG